MKNTRRFMAAVMALTMVSALAPMSVFADTVVDNNDKPAPESAGLDVKYTYGIPAPTYTVTIPAGVTLSDSDAIETSIIAENVTNMDANGKKIVVTLESASNDTDTDDTTFHALNGDSVATYTITADTTAVKVGDTVAEFTADGSSTLTFSEVTLPASPVVGDYTETLTFGITLKSQVIRFATPGRGETTYVTIPGASAENPVYFTGAYTGSATTESIAYSHSTAGSYDELYFNGSRIYHGDWNVGSALEITGGSGTETDPYVLTRV
jgi:hypothetical protein